MSKLLLVLCLVLAAVSLPAAPQPQNDCWGSDKPCSDGKYRDRFGAEQPAKCDNVKDNQHPCECSKATTKLEDCPPNNAQMDMSKCQVYCREQACDCITVCDNNDGT